MRARAKRKRSESDGLPIEVRQTLAVISGKWKLDILWLLLKQPHRFGELQRAIPGITQYMLSSNLRELETDGLVSRKVFPEVPIKVEYAATPMAKAFKPAIDVICTWGIKYNRLQSRGARPD